MNRPSEELLHKTLENRATAAEAASVAEWLATGPGQAWASRYIGRDFDRQEFCGDYEREEVASERIFARIRAALTRGRRRRILFRVAAVLIPVALVLGVALRLDRQVGASSRARSTANSSSTGAGARSACSRTARSPTSIPSRKSTIPSSSGFSNAASGSKAKPISR